MGKSGMLDIYIKAKENYSGKIMSLERTNYMSEITSDRPSFIPKPEAFGGGGGSLPPIESKERPGWFVIEDIVLGGVIASPFANNERQAARLTAKFNTETGEYQDPLLRWIIGGRVNNPFLALGFGDRATGEEARRIGEANTSQEAVILEANDGVGIANTILKTPEGENKLLRLRQVLKNGSIALSGPQRAQDVQLIQLGSEVLGRKKAEAKANLKPGAETFRDETQRMVNDLREKHRTQPTKPIIEYVPVLNDDTGEIIEIKRRVWLPDNFKNPRKEGYIDKREDLDEAQKGLTAEQKAGYELKALLEYYLGDPLIRLALLDSQSSIRVDLENKSHAGHMTEETRVRRLNYLTALVTAIQRKISKNSNSH